MVYEKTIPFTGNAAEALDIVKNTFIPNGYQITESTESSILLKGKNLLWLEKQNNPLIGISQIDIQISNSTISVKAELGNITKAIIAAAIFIIGMGLLMATIFSIIFVGKKEANALVAVFYSLSPWPVLVPLFFFFFKYRTRKAIDILLNNATGNETQRIS